MHVRLAGRPAATQLFFFLSLFLIFHSTFECFVVDVAIMNKDLKHAIDTCSMIVTASIHYEFSSVCIIDDINEETAAEIFTPSIKIKQSNWFRIETLYPIIVAIKHAAFLMRFDNWRGSVCSFRLDTLETIGLFSIRHETYRPINFDSITPNSTCATRNSWTNPISRAPLFWINRILRGAKNYRIASHFKNVSILLCLHL